jgi:restriction system protein
MSMICMGLWFKGDFMSVPDYQSLMLPLLKCAEHGAEVRTSECVDKIAHTLNLSDDDINELLPSGKQTLLSNRVFWAKTYMSKAKVIESTKRGCFKITDRGLELLKSKPEFIENKILYRFPEFASWKDKGSSNDSEPTKDLVVEDLGITPEEQIERAHLSITKQLQNEVLEFVLGVSPAQFERIIVDLLISMGYGGGRSEMGRALGRSNDGGVDGVIKEDELGLDVVYIQAKRYDPSNSIGRPVLQNFAGSLEGFNATKGVFVTTSSFVNSAYEYVQKIHKRIILIDGKELSKLMIRHNVGVRAKEIYEVKKIDEDYFAE